LDDYVFI